MSESDDIQEGRLYVIRSIQRAEVIGGQVDGLPGVVVELETTGEDKVSFFITEDNAIWLRDQLLTLNFDLTPREEKQEHDDDEA